MFLEFVLELSPLCHTNSQESRAGPLRSPAILIGVKSVESRYPWFMSPLCRSLAYVTSNKSLNLSAPWFPHMQNEDPNSGVTVKIK